MKRLLVLGGTQISCEIVKCAKKRGIFTIVADYNPVEKSPAKRIADENVLLDITNVEKTVDYVLTQSIDGIITGFSDMLLPYYADICSRTGLPCYGTRELFELFGDKLRYKELLRKFDIPTIEEYTEDDLNNGKVSFPVLVKPADSSGARGISICNSIEEAVIAIKKAKESSRNNNILIEKYVDGDEVTVFLLFADGKYYLEGIGNRHVKNDQKGLIPLPAGYTYPAKITPDYIKYIFPKVKEMLKSVDVRNGMMFMQCKKTDDICEVYDIGYRLTGSLEYKNFNAVCGYDPLDMMITFSLTGKMYRDISTLNLINPYLDCYTYNLSFLARPGRIAEYIGLETIKYIDGYIDAVIEHYPGEIVTNEMMGLLAQISLRVFGKASSVFEMWEQIDLIQNTVKILSDKGEMMNLSVIEKKDMDYVLNLR